MERNALAQVLPDRGRGGELRKWTPGIMDNMRWYASKALAPLFGGDVRAANAYYRDKIQPTAEYLPGVGDLMAAGEAKDAFSAGDYLGGGLLAAGAAAGLVPGIGDVAQKGVKAAVKSRGDEVLGLLKAGRGSEVTDDMLDMGNAADNANLNAYLFENYDLPMDEASRMGRARENWPKPSAHGTNTDILAIDNNQLIGGQFWSTDDVQAIADREVGAARHGVTIPLQLDVKNPAGWKEYDKFGTDELMGRGYDSLALKDEPSLMNPGTRTTYVTFNPEQVRSRFARFDPRLKHLRNLSAGVGGGALVLNALAAQQQPPEQY